MSVAPSDLIVEVSRAADPARAAAVAQKLQALSSSGAAASPADFASALNAAASGGAAAASTMPVRLKGLAPDAHKAETKLESVLLSQFIGEMLPKDAPGAFGSGYAGDMWRSMLAERVADQMAASGRLGIASRLFASHPLGGSAKALAPHAAEAAQASGNALSVAASAEVKDGSVLFAKSSPL